MKRWKHTSMLLVLMAGLLLASCIRDDLQPCPPLSVRIGIKDINYFNIDAVENVTGLDHRLDENLPFRSYIQKLFYVLYDIDRQQTVSVQHLHEVQGDARLATAYLPEDLPFGRYVLLVWANIESEEGILADGKLGTYSLHHNNVEGYDVYMTCDTLLYDEWNYDYTVRLERIKGKLLIEGVNLPTDINWSRKAITNLCGKVDYHFSYEPNSTEYVVVESDWSDHPSSRVVTDTYLSPTAVNGEKSTVYVRFFDDPSMSVPVTVPANVDITMRRNEITVLRYVYDADSGGFVISTWDDDSWQVIHDMGLE